MDAHDAAHYIAGLRRGGLGLPDRDYYTNDGAVGRLDCARAYVEHIAGDAGARRRGRARRATDARRSWRSRPSWRRRRSPRVARRDPAATDHPMTMAKLRDLAPNVDWTRVSARRRVSRRRSAKVNVAEPAFFTRARRARSASVPIDDWRAYLRYHVLSSAAPWLSTPFVDENFAFTSRFSGAKELLPRWKRCLRATDGTDRRSAGPGVRRQDVLARGAGRAPRR